MVKGNALHEHLQPNNPLFLSPPPPPTPCPVRALFTRPPPHPALTPAPSLKPRPSPSPPSPPLTPLTPASPPPHPSPTTSQPRRQQLQRGRPAGAAPRVPDVGAQRDHPVGADPSGAALSLEMVNGAVVLSVNMGVGHSFSARVSLKNKFSLCDNKWHTVKANYVKDSLTLRVDKHREAYGFNGSSNEKGTPTDAPLFVGGLPESALQGTLATRENFKGCIRNIVMNSERRDWTDMFQLQNVLLNACPVL
ncbi:hypothetical protein C7M84_018409 [Penaeus vannamei]|uniref:Laminin G domain-containing protein n=1 Tax=Penaeus vannamei TaxID=6689 RepID=A0A3R7PXV2_PENVA|nr:hypothetical protein C7M84_018409 [Penaeus vannamei]